MKKILFSLAALTTLLFATSCSNNDDIDREDPVISNAGIVAVPQDGNTFERGSVIPFTYLFTDNVELGNYNIEIHNNFDHHTHGTQGPLTPLDPIKKPVKPWIYNQSFSIPRGSTTYQARQNITIPDSIDTGDYHFTIRLTDQAGHQTLRAMAIKIR